MSDPGPAPSDEARRAVVGLICEVLERKKARFRREDVREGASLTRDLGIDSLDLLQLAARVEKKFGIKFPDAELQGLDELGAILAAIARLRAAR